MIQVWDGDGVAHVSAIEVDLEVAALVPNLQDVWMDTTTSMDLHLNHDHPMLEYLFEGAMFDEVSLKGIRNGYPWCMSITRAVVVDVLEEQPVGKMIRLSFAARKTGL